jgi:hypothetical protein
MSLSPRFVVAGLVAAALVGVALGAWLFSLATR